MKKMKRTFWSLEIAILIYSAPNSFFISKILGKPLKLSRR